jgi:co-chaperonin GroES (HSP10)
MEAISFNQDKPKLRMIGTKMLVKPDELKEMTVRGIIIPVANNNPLEEGTVILVSEDVAPYVAAGERVLYPKDTGLQKEYNGVWYKFLNGPTSTSLGDIWAII